MDNFDYIIVGGGSAGCVLAARLSEEPRHRVLLIESGRNDDNPWIHIPATFFKVLEGQRDVTFYAGEPDPGMGGRPTIVPQGHVIGGGSSVNAMIYIRGHADDYNTWAQMGCRNWSYDRVLPAFKAVEGNQRIDNAYHGTSGPLKVSDRSFKHPLSEAFVAAGEQVGLPRSNDFNGAEQEGVGFYQSTTYNGRRWSSAQAFLRDARQRQNLRIITEARVAQVLFTGRRASGVLLEDGRRFEAAKEIILTAGALATPKLLQLSGIGNAEHLRELGIEVVSDLPGVGENYQDHIEATVQGESHDPISLLGQDKGLAAVAHMFRYLTTRGGLLSSNVVECGGFADTAKTGQPDIQFHVLPMLVGFVDRAPVSGHGISIGPCFLRPQSRGTVKLRSAHAKDPILFNANALGDPADLETLVRGVKLAIKILEAPALAKLIKRRVLPEPGIENSPDELRDYIRKVSKTVFHPSGTSKMGPETDRMAVVGEDLKVRGVEGLRVSDASVMPTLVSGNTNAPTIMIAERASRFILGREQLA